MGRFTIAGAAVVVVTVAGEAEMQLQALESRYASVASEFIR